MNITENLMKAFGVSTEAQLQHHLKKTDLKSEAALLHAATVAHLYPERYEGVKMMSIYVSS